MVQVQREVENLHYKHLLMDFIFGYLFCSPTRPNPVGGGETCAETGINIFFSKVSKYG